MNKISINGFAVDKTERDKSMSEQPSETDYQKIFDDFKAGKIKLAAEPLQNLEELENQIKGSFYMGDKQEKIAELEKSLTGVKPSDDLTETKIILRETIKAWNESPKKSRYRSLVITHLEIAEGFLLKEQANGVD